MVPVDAGESSQFLSFFVLGHADGAFFLVFWEIVEALCFFELLFGQGTNHVLFQRFFALFQVHLFETVEEGLWYLVAPSHAAEAPEKVQGVTLAAYNVEKVVVFGRASERVSTITSPSTHQLLKQRQPRVSISTRRSTLHLYDSLPIRPLNNPYHLLGSAPCLRPP